GRPREEGEEQRGADPPVGDQGEPELPVVADGVVAAAGALRGAADRDRFGTAQHVAGGAPADDRRLRGGLHGGGAGGGPALVAVRVGGPLLDHAHQRRRQQRRGQRQRAQHAGGGGPGPSGPHQLDQEEDRG